MPAFSSTEGGGIIVRPTLFPFSWTMGGRRPRVTIVQNAPAPSITVPTRAPQLPSAIVSRAATTSPGQVPGGYDPFPAPSGHPATGPAWLRALEVIAALYAQERELRAAERAQRRAARAAAPIFFPQEVPPMALADVLGSVAQGIPSALTAYYNAQAARSLARSASGVPTGFVGGAILPEVLGPVLGAGALGGALLGGQPGALEEGGMLEGLESQIEREAVMWRRGQARVSPVREIYARHPSTGGIAVWKYAGRPILFSGDLAACKRVNKIARRAASSARRAGVIGRTFRRRRTVRRRR